MKNRILSFLLAVVTVFNVCSMSVFSVELEENVQETTIEETTEAQTTAEVSSKTEEGYITGMVNIAYENAVGNRLLLDKGQKEYAIADLSDEISDAVKYQWQMKLNDGKWSLISGFVLPYAIISEALVANTILEDGYAVLRCLVTYGDNKYVSNEIYVGCKKEGAAPVMMSEEEPALIEEEPAVMMLSARSSDPVTINESEEDGSDIFTGTGFEVVINYVFKHLTQAPNLDIDGTPAANTFTVSLPDGGYYSGTIASPYEEGYLPYVRVEDANFVTPGTSSPEVFVYGGDSYVAANSIEFNYVTSNETVYVYYIPQKVSFYVKIYEQNLYNDEYTLVATELIDDRIANEAVGPDYKQEREGFTYIPYDENEEISEDGSYAIDIYYDRNYYSVNFDIEKDVNGAVPYSVRYGTQIMLPNPTLAGYSFKKWELVEVTNGEKLPVTEHSYNTLESAGALVTVKHNLKYKDSWERSKTSYAVVYWLENADTPGQYDVWYTYKVENVITGSKTEILGVDNIKSIVKSSDPQFTLAAENDVIATYPYLTYEASLSDTAPQTLKGDGTTTVDVYYSRKQYTLKFYYAIEKIASNNSSTYHVIGGSTYYFGTEAASNARTDEVALMRQYASGNQTSNTGQVKNLPTLNEKGQSRNYTIAYDTDNSNNVNARYHYISFSAKYGADITNLWPCDVFNSVERSSRNTHGNWSGTTAFVSAWNGENRVKYTQDETVNNRNQTIKGNYTQLDSNLLWRDMNSVTEDTVAYACFWENGANIGWSVPELYRYNIYLPLIPGQSTEGLTLDSTGKYYLADSYDTVDDSSPSAQTQPGLVGFTSNGRSNTPITNFDTSRYREAYDMNFYYSRNEYMLTFNDQQGSIVEKPMWYDEMLEEHSNEEHAPAYPDGFEEGEFVFGGWYLDESCQIPFTHGFKMPAKNIQVYAKWNPLSYNIKVYSNKDKDKLILNETVRFGSFVIEPEHASYKPNDTVVFAGWYYMDGDQEKRFDFNTMAIKKDMELYAKWPSQSLVGYKVYYVYRTYDSEGNVLSEIDIAPPSLDAKGVEGTTKTFTALVGDSLNPGYKAGYFPEMRSHSMTLSPNAEDNVYKFVYTAADEMTYWIRHTFVDADFINILKEPVAPVGEEDTVSVDGLDTITYQFKHTISGENISDSAASVMVSFREGITKQAIVRAAEQKIQRDLSPEQEENLWTVVKGLSPDCFEQKLILTTGEENVSTFNWNENDNSAAPYQIIYYYEDLSGEYVPSDNINMGSGTTGDTVTVHVDSGLEAAGTGRYLVNRELTNVSENEEYLTGTIERITINDDGSISEGLVLRLYYSLKRYTCTIEHKKYVNGEYKLVSSNEKIVPHGTTIVMADEAINIEGYIISNGDHKAVITKDQVVTCQYIGQVINYVYQIAGSKGGNITPSSVEVKFGEESKGAVLTLYDGYFLKTCYYVVGKGEQTPVPATWLSNNEDGKTVITPKDPPVDWTGKTIYIYAEVLPTTRRFAVSGIDEDHDHSVFVYNLKGKENTATAGVNVTIVIAGNDYIYVEELPYGEYTLQILDWSWRYALPTVYVGGYQADVSGTTFDVTLDREGEVVFEYSDVHPSHQWLTDETANSLKFS